MKAGLELNAKIATEVMGWRRMSWKDYHSHMKFNGIDEREEFTYAWHDADGNMTEFHANDELYYDDPTPAWSPSEEMADAWLVVEKLGQMQMQGHVGPSMLHRLRECATKGWGVIWCSDFGYTQEVFAPTAPLAICLAALKTVENK